MSGKIGWSVSNEAMMIRFPFEAFAALDQEEWLARAQMTAESQCFNGQVGQTGRLE